MIGQLGKVLLVAGVAMALLGLVLILAGRLGLAACRVTWCGGARAGPSTRPSAG